MSWIGEKLTSRKFWFCVAAFLASLGTGISGVATRNEWLAGFGLACSIVSAAIYTACESAVDVASAAANGTTTTKAISASTTAKDVAATALAGGAATAADKEAEQ